MMRPTPRGSVQTETPGCEAGHPINCQTPAGEYPEGRALLEQRTGGRWHMKK